MPQIISGVAGPALVSDGVSFPVRQGRMGEAVVTELHGKFYEQTARGRTFWLSHPLAGVAAGASALVDTLSTTGTWALANPVGSGINLSVLMIGLNFIRVPTAAGTHWITWSANTVTPLATGTLSTPLTGLIGNTNASGARAYFGATLPVVPAQTILWALYNQGTGAVTVADSLDPPIVYPDGSLVVAPGNLISGQAVPQAAAALTNVVTWTVAWEEVPI